MRFRYAFIIIFTALLLSSCNLTLAADITPPPDYVPPTAIPTLGPLWPAQAPDIRSGAEIYVSSCLPCHGATGLGDGAQGKQLPVTVAALGLPETARPASPARWFTVVSQGNIERFMPAFTSLSEQERWDVVAYALSLHFTPEMLEQGRQLFEENCSGCDTGFFMDQEKMAALAQDDLARLVRQGGEGLEPFGATLSEQEIYAVAAWLRSLSFAQPPAATAALAPATATSGTAAGTAPGTQPAGESTSAPETTPESGTPGEGTSVAGTPAAATGPAVSALEGPVSGTVMNQTGELLPGGLVVTLRGFDHAQDASGPQETLTLETGVAPDGTYRFETVPLLERRIFMVEIEYQDITYQTEFKVVESGTAQLTFDPVTIYESTTDFSGLVVDELHIGFDFGTGQSVQAFEIFSFTNKSREAVIVETDGSEIPFIKTPVGAEGVGIEPGENTAPYAPVAGGGFAILPSEKPYSLIVFFTLPYDSGGTTVEQPLIIETGAVSVFVPAGIKLRGDDLRDAGEQQISGALFRIYNSEGRPAGSQLSFSLSGNPVLTTDSSTGTSNRQALIFGAGALGLALIAVGVWMYLRDRSSSPESQAELDSDDEFEDSESILDAIIALDDLHRAGKLPDAAYQTRRAELKEQLKKMEGGNGN